MGSIKMAAVSGVIACSTAARLPNGTLRKPGVNGPKPFGREGDDCGSSAMKIAVGNDDLGAVSRNALDLIGPSSCRLDGGLDRFRTSIHWQRSVKPGQSAQLREEWPKTVVVISPRRDGEASSLLLKSGKNGGRARGSRPSKHSSCRRIAAPRHPIRLPLGRAQEHGKRFIVVSAVAGLKLDLIHRLTPREAKLLTQI